MGSGGPRGLQIRRRRGFAGTGGFDSHTLPPDKDKRKQESQLGAARNLSEAAALEAGTPSDRSSGHGPLLAEFDRILQAGE